MTGPVCISQFTVTLPGQRVYFQVKIPCGAVAVTGLFFSIYGWTRAWDWKALNYTPDSAGQVTLAWQEHGDVFYAGEVDFDPGRVDDATAFKLQPLPLTFTDGPWNYGWKIEPVSVRVEEGNTVICGYYQDIVSAMNQPGGVANTYTVKAYFYFAGKEEQQ